VAPVRLPRVQPSRSSAGPTRRCSAVPQLRGGRQLGAPNKHLEVAERLAGLRCDPITGMARIAMNKRNPVELRGRVFAELAQYVAPKRKALEHSAEPGLIEEVLSRIDA
jgi:hypothetical protein